jgi:hypothetical protein
MHWPDPRADRKNAGYYRRLQDRQSRVEMHTVGCSQTVNNFNEHREASRRQTEISASTRERLNVAAMWAKRQRLEEREQRA